ncbi:two-component system, OmpR family, sensor histidine kinase MprB [Amycolatopsis pretoriensis]|uniref:histidine kinase n=1 Tax=Amycolatopsis pretoriensis TaxID=218821 RepID=A0A1H5R1I4_9PSEU|nr:HAMP domain-containing sensor histidine kinase [Amycolatopsis pretoriensis]SEF32252.1 two-component system, OmpR family, sensor histidine kinase MprB [Amycolatopsis pretoriensis]
MSARWLLRTRVALVTAGVVAVAIAGICLISWLTTRYTLRTQLDQNLLAKGIPTVKVVESPAGQPAWLDPSVVCTPPEQGRRQLQRFLEGIQLLHADGSGCAPDGVDEVVTTSADHAVTDVTLRDGRTASGVPVRLVLRPVGNGDVLVISRGLAAVDDTLASLGAVLVVAGLSGVLTAGAAGLLLARRTLNPMRRLTETAEHIARTEDLLTPVAVTGRDEVSRLGRAFSAMTTALHEARLRQRQLVTDAAHELRTPLTSLRANIDLLVRSEQTRRAIPPGRRAAVLDRLQAQAREFSTLVGELVELARESHQLARETVSVAAVIERAVRRAAHRAAEHTITTDTTPWATTGDPTALERAVLNVLDNAIKFSPPGASVQVRSGPGWLTVSDQGPGLPPHERGQAFERFWRAPAARALPGSGLGLAMVANTVSAHGGTARFSDPPAGRGAHLEIELPVRDDPTESGHTSQRPGSSGPSAG